MHPNYISEYTYICTKWILKRNGKYRCGNFGDINWTITPLIDTDGNGLVLSSDGKNAIVKNDISASNQRWLLSKKSSNLTDLKVETLIIKLQYLIFCFSKIND
jgi:hypothetical protein